MFVKIYLFKQWKYLVHTSSQTQALTLWTHLAGVSDLLEHQITFRHYCNAYVGAWLVHDDTYLDSAGLPLSAKDTPCFICCLKWPKHDICNFAVFLASFTYPNISFIPSWFLLCEWYERLPNMMGGVFIAAIYPPLCPFIGTHCLMDPKPHFRLIFSPVLKSSSFFDFQLVLMTSVGWGWLQAETQQEIPAGGTSCFLQLHFPPPSNLNTTVPGYL